MAHGLPIIAGNLPTEIVIKDKTGFFINPRNPDDIAEKLAIFTDKKLFLDFSRAAFEHVIKNFSWENVIKRIIKLYMAVLAGEA
jgi:glycosyltransferase involved in cell wall biosynthesis